MTELREKIVELAKEMRGKGFRVEADLLVLAADIAQAAMGKQSEVYHHSLISLHNLACDRLEELDHADKEPERPKRLN